MTFPNAEKPATAGTVNGLQEVCLAGERDRFLNATSKPKTQGDLADRRKLPGLSSATSPDLGMLEIFAYWRHDLTCRIHRAQLRFELIGLDPNEQDQLVAEVAEFKRACRAAAWRPGRSA